MAEQGYADAQVTPWFGIVVPAGTPEPIVERISKALEAALASPDVRQNSTSPDASRKVRRSASSPASSRTTSRYGRRWSRTPASRPD